MIFSPLALAQEPTLDTNVNAYDKIPNNNQNSNQQNNISSPFNKTFTARVHESQYLPPAFYGTWQVSQFLITSNAPYLFKKRTQDIWVLQQIGDTIHLTNPDSGGKSKITVNQVHNNTATFTCEVKDGKRLLREQPTITVVGDTFKGQNIFQIKHYQKKKLIFTQEAILRIEGRKISGPTPKLFENSGNK
ncbi:MAG: hypothetical protein AB7V50_04405 [Vampirovibrionia bacterium]